MQDLRAAGLSTEELHDFRATGELPLWFERRNLGRYTDQLKAAETMTRIREAAADAKASGRLSFDEYKPWVLKELAELSILLDRALGGSDFHLNLSRRLRELRTATLPHLDPIHRDQEFLVQWRAARKEVAAKLEKDLSRNDLTPAEKVTLIDGTFHLRQVHVAPTVGGLVNDRRAYLFVRQALKDLEWPVLSAILRLDGGLERLAFRLINRYLLSHTEGQPRLQDSQFEFTVLQLGSALSEHAIRYMAHVRFGRLELGDPVLGAIRTVVSRAKQSPESAERLEQQGLDLQLIADNVARAFLQCEAEVCSGFPLHSASRDILDTLIEVYRPIGTRTFRAQPDLEFLLKRIHGAKVAQDPRGPDPELVWRFQSLRGILGIR